MANNNNFRKIVTTEIVAEKAQRGLQILYKLRELRNTAIFAKFVAEWKVIKIVVVLHPGYTINK